MTSAGAAKSSVARHLVVLLTAVTTRTCTTSTASTDFGELPLPDQLHPDTATHRRIAERFTKRVFSADGPFAGPSS
ncbi:hypothetical protein [Micromonospora sp. A202]|uniref:hypothetical protein n=1 Tax=Micromonospora sp. A202 TaxID=2572899 RepID=UPI00210555DB|nr:hypothetical protein [Micromonospora sp. A202]